MEPREIAIQMLHDQIVSDLLTIARQYDHLRQSSPDAYLNKVRTEMRRFLRRQKQHTPFIRFSQLYDVNQDEFIADVYKSATQLLDGTEN